MTDVATVPSKFITFDEFARETRTSRRHVERLVKTGRVRHVRMGRCVRIPRAELERLLAESPKAA